MNELIEKLKRLPSNFWLYNLLFGLLLMFLLKTGGLIALVVFPLNLALIISLIETTPQIDDMYARYIGFFPVFSDMTTVIGRALIGILVWFGSFKLAICLLILYFLLKDRS